MEKRIIRRKSVIRCTIILFIGCVLIIWGIILVEVFNHTVPLRDIDDDEEGMHISNMLPILDDNPDENITNKLINLKNFEYLINQPACYYDKNANETDSLITVILIHSAPTNFQKRITVRETWGQKSSKSRIFFVLGATNSTSLQNQLFEENEQYNDLIQGNFLDSYRNLTYKHVMSLKWFVNNCPNVKFLLRADDDIFVNLPYIYQIMHFDIDSLNMNNLIVCHKMSDNSIVIRRRTSKWRVSKKEYGEKFYPGYCFGYAIIYTNSAVRKIYRQAQNETSFFWVDDIYVSGVLRQRSNVSIISFESHYYINEDKLNDLLDGRVQLNDVISKFAFVKPNLKEEKIRKLWKILNNSSDLQ